MANEQKVLSMSRADYDKRGEVNWSTLKLIGKSPAHYMASLLRTVEADTDPRKRGRAVHVAALEPDRFRSEYVVYPERRAGKAWEKFVDDNAGREIITTDMHLDALAIAAAVKAIPAAAPLVSGGRSELTVLWTFVRPDMGGLAGYSTHCRSRLDFVANVGAIVDLKTTRDASPAGFGREVARYGYHAQAAFYQDAYFAATGERLPYKFVAIEAAAPHVGAVYRMTDEAFELGRTQYVDYMDRLNLCRTENRWPGYADGEVDVELPGYMLADDDENQDLSSLLKMEAP